MSSLERFAKQMAVFHRVNRKGRPRENKPFSLKAMPTEWDAGASGPANRKGLVREDAADFDPTTGKVSNPNGVKRFRRVDMLEVWVKKGDITVRGYNAAAKLRDAFEATGRTPSVDPTQDRVDSSPKPDHAVTIQIERLSRFHAFNKHVSKQDRPMIETCVLDGRTPSVFPQYRRTNWRKGIAELSAALERLADALES